VAGKIKLMIDKIIEQRSKGNETIRNITKAKLMLKGVNPDGYSIISEDDPQVIARLVQIAGEMGVKI
jgi:hypothetical protein